MLAARATVLGAVIFGAVVAGCTADPGDEACEPGDCPAGQVCADGECRVPPACSPETCDGCCQGDACLAGDEAAACGEGGAGCQLCPGDAACEGGSCIVPCGPDTCSGCCSPTEGCLAGDRDEACGGEGGACFDCADGACSSGRCIGAACAGECAGCCDGDACIPEVADKACGKDGEACVPCADGTSCQGGACVVDPGSLWNLVLLNGEVPATDFSGASWDAFGGLPDPLLALTLTAADESQTSYQSAYRDDTLVPEWNETVLTGQPASALLSGQGNTLTFHLQDADVSYHDAIGSCTSDGFANDHFGAVVTVTCPANPATMNSGWLLRFRLEQATEQ